MMRAIYQKFCLAFILFSMLSVTAQAADGDLDTTYGTGGKVTVDFNGNPTPGERDQDSGIDVAIQPDGKIVIVGESFIATTDSVFSATRINTDGSVDTSFAVNGRFLYNEAVGVSDRATGVAIQPDGKILIAGWSNAFSKRVVLRLNSDGTLDSSFGSGGVFVTGLGSPTLEDAEIALQTDGKIIVSGATRNGGQTTDAFSVMRLNPNGTFDNTFDTDGQVVTGFGTNDRAFGVKVQSDGKIIASGSTNFNGAMALARYNSDGSLDTSFDGDGKVTTAFPAATSLAHNLLIQPDGKILATGYARTFHADGALVRYNPDGSLDTSFSGDGKATFGTTSDELFWEVHLRNNKIICTGNRALSDPSSIEDFMIVRFNNDGSLDTGFATNGVRYTDFNITRDISLSSVFQPDGKLVLAGYSTATVPFNPDFAAARFNFSSPKSPFDFDGDGKTDISIFRPINGGTAQWWWQESSTNTVRTVEWGLQTDVPAAADYDGDGKTDIAVWRPGPATQAAFYILNSSNNTVRSELFGQTGDNSVVIGDYDGDGKADPAVYRAGAQSYFYYRGSLNNPSGNVTYIPWGTTGDKPVAGDYNGDGKMDFAIFRNGVWWILQNGTLSYEIRYWGLSTDKLVPGDYDGDGKTDLAVFRPSEGTWYIRNSSNGSNTYQAWGLDTDLPVPADYDGDGKTDLGVYRNGGWYVSQSSNASLRIENFGTATDTPIPSIFVIP